MTAGPLTGRRVVTTRDAPGELDDRLRGLGADVVHVPLIAIDEAPDGGVGLRRALDRLADTDWLVVTSRHGARRVGVAVGAHHSVRLAAVGAGTASELAVLAGRPVDVVPERQTAAGLVEAMPMPTGDTDRVLIAQADRAPRHLVDALAERGYRATAVTAYSTRLRFPSPAERAAALAADAVTFASGSAAAAWVEAIGIAAPGVVVAIGPTTADVAEEVGLKVTHVAADHHVDGLVAAVTAALGDGS